MPVVLETPKEIALRVAQRVRQERLSRGWTRAQIAERAGMPLMTYRLFERTGQISVERLLSIAISLGRAAEWDTMFRPRVAQSLDELDAARPSRVRGIRKSRSTSRAPAPVPLPPGPDSP